MTGAQPEQPLSERIDNGLEAIISDLSGRGGIGDQWGMIDDEIQAEIKTVWRDLVRMAVDTDFVHSEAHDTAQKVKRLYDAGVKRLIEHEDDLEACAGEGDLTVKKYKDPTPVELAVLYVIEAFSDRRGLGQGWKQIDPDIQEEVFDAWAQALQASIEGRRF